MCPSKIGRLMNRKTKKQTKINLEREINYGDRTNICSTDETVDKKSPPREDRVKATLGKAHLDMAARK